MIYLKAEKQANQYYFQVILDETKTDIVNPDPLYMKEYYYALINDYTGSGYIDETDYVNMIKREIPLLVQDELNRIEQINNTTAPTPLAGF